MAEIMGGVHIHKHECQQVAEDANLQQCGTVLRGATFQIRIHRNKNEQVHSTDHAEPLDEGRGPTGTPRFHQR